MAAQAENGAVTIGGRKLAWSAVGEGPPLLLVNGYAARAADWDPTFLAELARERRVVCPDNRGLGGSDLGEEPCTIEAMAADLAALLEALAIERAPVVGWSMGGFLAQRLAVAAPQRVASLALIGTDPGGASAVAADPTAWARLTDHGGTPREQASRLISLLFPPEQAAAIDRDFGEIVAAGRAELPAATLSAQEEAMREWHREEPPRPPEPAPPVLVLHGELDEVIPVENAAALRERYPGAQVELFAGCGHALMAQEPRRAAAAIAAMGAG